jgi:UDP-galactose transporter B1
VLVVANNMTSYKSNTSYPLNTKTVINIEQPHTRTPTDFPEHNFTNGYTNNNSSGDTGISIGTDLHQRVHFQSQTYSHPMNTISTAPKSRWKSMLEMAQCCMGIYISFVVLSFFQEKITRRPYGSDENKEFFNFPLFLVFLQCLCNSVTAYGKMYVTGGVKIGKSDVPVIFFAAASFSYVTAFFSSNAALIYINYPTQVLAKSCKMIPVVLMGFIFARKSYSVQQLVAVGLISFGISIFMFDRFGHKDNKGHGDSHDNNFIGLILLAISLLGDGLTATLQSKMREFKVRPSSDELMLMMNAFAVGFVGLGLILSGTLIPALHFCFKHPEAVTDIIILCLCMSIGQVFIYWSIASYGPLMCSIITTTRKFFTILFSVFWYGHHMSVIQWISIVIVFVGLMWEILVEELEAYLNKGKQKGRKEK